MHRMHKKSANGPKNSRPPDTSSKENLDLENLDEETEKKFVKQFQQHLVDSGVDIDYSRLLWEKVEAANNLYDKQNDILDEISLQIAKSKGPKDTQKQMIDKNHCKVKVRYGSLEHKWLQQREKVQLAEQKMIEALNMWESLVGNPEELLKKYVPKENLELKYADDKEIEWMEVEIFHDMEPKHVNIINMPRIQYVPLETSLDLLSVQRIVKVIPVVYAKQNCIYIDEEISDELKIEEKTFSALATLENEKNFEVPVPHNVKVFCCEEFGQIKFETVSDMENLQKVIPVVNKSLQTSPRIDVQLKLLPTCGKLEKMDYQILKFWTRIRNRIMHRFMTVLYFAQFGILIYSMPNTKFSRITLLTIPYDRGKYLEV